MLVAFDLVQSVSMLVLDRAGNAIKVSHGHVTAKSHLSDVILKDPRYCLCMFSTLSSDVGKVLNRESVIPLQVFEGFFKV